jgi:hypothetical protein
VTGFAVIDKRASTGFTACDPELVAAALVRAKRGTLFRFESIVAPGYSETKGFLGIQAHTEPATAIGTMMVLVLARIHERASIRELVHALSLVTYREHTREHAGA